MRSFRNACETMNSNGLRDLHEKLGIESLSLQTLAGAALIHKAFKDSGGPLGPLGRPVSGFSQAVPARVERSFKAGTVVIQDKHDGVEWPQPLKVRIDYVGLETLDESNEASERDEPYLIISVAGPGVNVTKLVGPYSVNAGDRDNAYAGPIAVDIVPNELILSTVIREKDQGSSEEAKALVSKRIGEIATLATSALAVYTGDFQALEKSADWVTKLPGVNVVAGLVSNLLGMGDDNVGQYNKALFQTISNTKPPSTEDFGPKGTFRGNPYNFVTEDIGSGKEGIYKVYYLITVYQAPPPQPV